MLLDTVSISAATPVSKRLDCERMSAYVAARQNLRPYMEDFVAVHPDLRAVARLPPAAEACLEWAHIPSGAPITLAIVADGHGGAGAAKFAIERLPACLVPALGDALSGVWASVTCSDEVISSSVSASRTPLDSAAPVRGGCGSPSCASSVTVSLPAHDSTPALECDGPAIPRPPSIRGRRASVDTCTPVTPAPRSKSSSSAPSPRPRPSHCQTQSCEGVLLTRAASAALARALTALDQEWCEGARPTLAADGACVNAVLTLGPYVLTANIGDCRAVAVNATDAVALSVDHKPNNPGEVERICAAGGRVKYASGEHRVFPARLAVSRSVGDVRWKDRGLISGQCDVTVHALTPASRWIVLASDGVWGKLSAEDVHLLLRKCTPVPVEPGSVPCGVRSSPCLRSHDVKCAPCIPLLPSSASLCTPTHPADLIADAAITRGATDNISVVALFITPVYAAHTQSPS